ncbi:Sperm-specific antigen 2 like protein [Chelonia mydas]|uniref:Sperm-specific antigen 2 like protein n=1 Tax=Chelonia mydas TaxID=8469 RepID=M7AP82_CHEMY|nr:Sperm-specific antigen 2 like protein [Chelonia mydas]
MLVRNGGSFEDDLSLGAEVHHVSIVYLYDSNGMLAKERRHQFHQKGRSMNSTGSGRSSATVSSVSELLDLYEEDPEEVLYNLGFGRDEPDIASKIPSRFFNSSSFARGIDIKVFLNAQMQRMEVENPNFALTSRFRQIEVLTTVANAFSSLYSQVSGTPLQKIGSMNSVSSNKETSNPAPLNRSNTASRLMKTLSKLSLSVPQQAGESSSCTTPPAVEKGKMSPGQGTEENDVKNESKLPKHLKKKDSPSLATVKEEISSNQPNIIDILNATTLSAGISDKQGTQDDNVPHTDEQKHYSPSHQNRLSEESGIVDSSNLSSDANISTNNELENSTELQNPSTSTPDKEPCAPIASPSITILKLPQKDSFEMEERDNWPPERSPIDSCTPPLQEMQAESTGERQQSTHCSEDTAIQSTEGEAVHVPTSHQLYLTNSRRDQLLRTASQHSDSSGFAEDSSTDCFSLSHLQVALCATLSAGTTLVAPIGREPQPMGAAEPALGVRAACGAPLLPPCVGARDGTCHCFREPRGAMAHVERGKPLTPLPIRSGVHESLQAMGSSADSCDSETTVKSLGEEIKTPIAKEQMDFNEFEEKEEFLLIEVEVPSKNRTGDVEKIMEHVSDESQGSKSKQTQTSDMGQGDFSTESEEVSTQQKESELLEEGSDESDLDKSSECEFPQYQTHHILRSMASIESSSSSPSAVDRVNVALQRAQTKISSTSDSRVGRTLLTSKDLLLLKQRHPFAGSGYPLRRSQSLPTTLLNPVRVVSSVNVRLSPGKETLCSPPSFTYKYTPEGEEKPVDEDKKSVTKTNDSPPTCKTTLFIAPSPTKKETSQSGLNRSVNESSHNKSQSCPLSIPAHTSQSTCSLHSIPSDWQDRPLCEHMRTLSNHSIPSISGSSCGAPASAFGCPYSPRHAGYPHRPHAINPPSTVEMQLRRVLHDIRNSLQNLSQNTFQELQVVRQSLNLFRTQMMDLELTMLRQQTTVYQHMTEEERYEADQLQSLRKSVRMELQELEMQLEERLLALEEQLRTLHMSSPYRPQTLTGMYGSRSTDNLSCFSPLNVMEPVSELIREQSFLKSELGLGEFGLETLPAEGSESLFSHGNSDSSSVCSSHTSRKAAVNSSELTGKSKTQSKKLYRASVALTPTPPARAGTGQQAECSEESVDSKSEVEQKLEKVPLLPSVDEIHRSVENEELQQVIREVRPIAAPTGRGSPLQVNGGCRGSRVQPNLRSQQIKESIVGEIRREIVSGLLAAVSSPSRSANAKQDTQP